MGHEFGNQLTANALTVDDGKALIKRALTEVKERHGWSPREAVPLFLGVYYDQQKVGSFITRVTNGEGGSAVLKLQLRPLPFDEGMIIRHVQRQIKTNRIRLPELFFDLPWDASMGYGYLLMEDLSHIPHLWSKRPDENTFTRHKTFLSIFMHEVLPIEPYLPTPQTSPQSKYRESLTHFSSIAAASRYRHIHPTEIERMKETYLKILEGVSFDGFHFTHGHLSGHEILDDRTNNVFILFANLAWSFRPASYELLFPLWVDLMAIRDANVSRDDLIQRIDRWKRLWRAVEGTDLDVMPAFWFGILERSLMTVMLDLGASEWRDDEQKEKQALLNAWKELFYWTASEKFSNSI